MSSHTSEAVHATFNKYIAHISKKAIEAHGASYMTYQDCKNNWRFQLPYSANTEAFLIMQTKVFIRMLDARDARSTNLGFLKPLVNEMADFLSAYTMRAGDVKRSQEIKRLKAELWDNNAYIQELMARQAENRKNKEPRTPQSVAQKRKQIQIQQAKRDMELAKQVKGEFVAAGYRYHKK